jgi:hypothetical protein
LNIFKDQTKTTYYPIFRGGRPNHTIQIIKWELHEDMQHV